MVAKTRRFCPPVLICPSETLAYFLNGYIQSYRLNSPSFCPFVFHFCTCHDFGIKEKLIKAPTYGTISLSPALQALHFKWRWNCIEETNLKAVCYLPSLTKSYNKPIPKNSVDRNI